MINKAAIALFMAISLWMILMFDAYDIFVERSSPLFQEFLTQNPEMANAPLKDQFITFITNRSIVYHLGNVSETLFFVMCSMLIVDIVDKHGGFRAVTGYIRTANKRKLLWYISFAAFFFSALLDNYLYQNQAKGFGLKEILWRRVLDVNDRSLRSIVVGLGPKSNGITQESGFDITPASEIMAILCLAQDVNDLRRRIENILLGFTYDDQPFTVKDLGVAGAITVLLKDAIHPNLVQTTEGTAAFVHGGPFANIAHGCNSILAT